MAYRNSLRVPCGSEDVDGVVDTIFKSKNDIKIKDWHKMTASWSRVETVSECTA